MEILSLSVECGIETFEDVGTKMKERGKTKQTKTQFKHNH